MLLPLKVIVFDRSPTQIAIETHSSRIENKTTRPIAVAGQVRVPVPALTRLPSLSKPLVLIEPLKVVF